MKNKMTVIDFFCGAGGFSEGFRQQNFKIVMGVDNWNPAVQTHNLNHDLSDPTIDILKFEKSIEAIDMLPDTDIIIGSPPCVNFSMANRAGKADKSLGIRLIEAYLRVVAVKKHQSGSILKAWLMENVPNSRNFVQETYSFTDLNLSEWAVTNNIDPESEALKVKNNGGYYVAADYGSPQTRERFICGEVISTGKFPEPEKTHQPKGAANGLKAYKTLGDIKDKLPKPNQKIIATQVSDPNYPHFSVPMKDLSDHFYDTGLYKVEWEKAKLAKIDHPFMGKMSFPEDESRPSRTIMATRSASTREALIYRSEFDRKGDGEFRLPTIREASTLMGFPFNYQFTGSEGSKWRQIGNAVCPHMSAALAKQINKDLGKKEIAPEKVAFACLNALPKDHIDLNDPREKSFDKQPTRKAGSKFRMHIYKEHSITPTLTNYPPQEKSDPNSNGKKWFASLFMGSGKNYSVIEVDDLLSSNISAAVLDAIDVVQLNEIITSFLAKVSTAGTFQYFYSNNIDMSDNEVGPIQFMKELKTEIDKVNGKDNLLNVTGLNKPILLKQAITVTTIFEVVSKLNNYALENNTYLRRSVAQIIQPRLLEKDASKEYE